MKTNTNPNTTSVQVFQAIYPVSPTLFERLAKLKETLDLIVDYQNDHPEYDDCLDDDFRHITNSLGDIAARISNVAGYEILAEAYYANIKSA